MKTINIKMQTVSVLAKECSELFDMMRRTKKMRLFFNSGMDLRFAHLVEGQLYNETN